MKLITKLNGLFCFVFFSVAFCHRQSCAAERCAVLSSRSIRTHSHCSLLATGRDELVLLRSRSDPTKQTQRRQTNIPPGSVCRSRLQLRSDSRQLRCLTTMMYFQILRQFLRKKKGTQVHNICCHYGNIAMYTCVLHCVHQSTTILSKVIG